MLGFPKSLACMTGAFLRSCNRKSLLPRLIALQMLLRGHGLTYGMVLYMWQHIVLQTLTALRMLSTQFLPTLFLYESHVFVEVDVETLPWRNGVASPGLFCPS